jgi:hypothetical protein
VATNLVEEALRDCLRAFPEPNIQSEDHGEAAQMNNQCRERALPVQRLFSNLCDGQAA